MSAKKHREARGISAWLVTWEHAGEHAKPRQRVAAVLNPRLSGQKVLEIVELLYANESYDPSERIAVVKNRRSNPYPARFGALEGVPWEGEIVCGHNPWLEARLVRNLRAQPDSTGEEQFLWEERPKPRLLRAFQTPPQLES
jgi:hypothetical protein